ncbi:MAG: hypothetical protein P8174_07135, partial [Gemmatimonadota bacterium]
HVVRDSAGIVVVDNRTAAWRDGSGWSLDRQPILDLGSADAPAAYQFQNIVAAGRLPDGGYVVADAGRNQLLFYDASGKHRATAGRPGGGPGEFRWLSTMTVSGDSVLAYDPRLGRLSIFGPDASLRGTAQLAEPGDTLHPLQMYGLAGVVDGRLIMAPRTFMPAGQSDVGTYWDSAAVLAYGMDGTLLGETAEQMGAEMFVSTRGSAGVLFGRRSSATTDSASVFVADERRYEIHVYGPGGGLQRIIRRAWDPRPVTREDRDSLLHYLVRQAGFPTYHDPRAALLRGMLESAPTPDHMPAHSAILADPQGTLWVAAYQLPWEPGPLAWSIFDPDGSWLGQVDTPEGFTVLRLTGDAVLGVQRDSLDVQHFQVLRVHR